MADMASAEEVVHLNFNQLLERCFLEASGSSSAAPPPAPPGAHGSAQQQQHQQQAADPALKQLQHLDLAARRAAQLSLVNPEEEQLREVSTNALRSLFIQSLRGAAEANVRTGFDGHAARKRRLANSRVSRLSFQLWMVLLPTD